MPGCSRRRRSTVSAASGQTIVIGGLITNSNKSLSRKVPWLGDLPVIGTLFRSTNFQRGESELVIIVSAHLVTPVDNESDLALPTDRIRIPNESSLFLLGETVAPADGGAGLTGAGFDGDFGYVVE